MITLNFDFKITDLGGNPIDGFNTKEAVANALASGQSLHPVRMMEYARKIFNEGKIEVPSEDVQKIKTAIEQSRLTDLVKAQILEIIK